MSGMISVTCSRIQVPRKPFLDSYYKSRQGLITNHDSFFYYKSRQGRITNHVSFFITNHDKFITNHDRYYKLRQLLQITTEHASPAVNYCWKMSQENRLV